MTEYMPFDQILAEYRDGDEHGWDTEFAYLGEHHNDQMRALVDDIRTNGIREPILLGNDGRLWDGHHRLAAARIIGLTMIPVERT